MKHFIDHLMIYLLIIFWIQRLEHILPNEMINLLQCSLVLDLLRYNILYFCSISAIVECFCFYFKWYMWLCGEFRFELWIWFRRHCFTRFICSYRLSTFERIILVLLCVFEFNFKVTDIVFPAVIFCASMLFRVFFYIGIVFL